jgi:2-C-methyl-D-erythritol 4-phosphate cytidylyltransferase
MSLKQYALIVAGGKGTRIPGAVPKQFLEIRGLPVLMHTVNVFFRYSADITVIVVLPQDDIGSWNDLCVKHGYDKPVIIQAGGDTRYQSVKLGLSRIEGNGLVAIHDGVRPLVDPLMIRRSFELAEANLCAVAAVPLKESVRLVGQDSTKALDRTQYRLIQTPQTFHADLIRKAYEGEDDATLTDDASVAERAGHRIHLFDGSYENIKITTPEDLILVRSIMEAKTIQTG